MKTLLKKRPLSDCVNINELHKHFDLRNFTGADLNAFVEAAARNAAWKENNGDLISLEDFKEAIKGCKSSLKDEDLVYY